MCFVLKKIEDTYLRNGLYFFHTMPTMAASVGTSTSGNMTQYKQKAKQIVFVCSFPDKTG